MWVIGYFWEDSTREECLFKGRVTNCRQPHGGKASSGVQLTGCRDSVLDRWVPSQFKEGEEQAICLAAVNLIRFGIQPISEKPWDQVAGQEAGQATG